MSSRTLWLVVNSASGRADQLAPSDLGDALGAAGWSIAHVTCLPDDPLPGPCDLSAAGAGLLAVHGGDGTVNSAVRRLAGWAGQVLVLPGGTQNLLSHRLHGDADAAALVEALGRGALVSRRIPGISSRHGLALSEVIAGPGATWSDLRETMRDGDLVAMAGRFAEAVRQSAAGPAVHLDLPPAGREEGYPAVRLHVKDQGIAADGYAADGVADFARQGVAILRRDFRQGPHDCIGQFQEVVLRSEAPIELAIDGERITGEPEERFGFRRCDLEFLALGN